MVPSLMCFTRDAIVAGISITAKPWGKGGGEVMRGRMPISTGGCGANPHRYSAFSPFKCCNYIPPLGKKKTHDSIQLLRQRRK